MKTLLFDCLFLGYTTLNDSSPIDWKPFQDLTESLQHFVLTSHVRPDADALGSELGLAGILKKMGKSVRILNASPTPPRLTFLDPSSEIETLDEQTPSPETTPIDAIIVLDTSSWKQLDSMADFIKGSTAKRIVIDHHLSADDLGAEMFKDTTASATGELITELGTFLGIPFDPSISAPLFSAVATDTGWFRFRSVDSRTYRVAAHLVETGAEPDKLHRQLYELDTLGRLKLMGTALERLKVIEDKHLAYTIIRRDDFEKTGAIPPDTEDLVNLTLTMEGINVGLIFIEQLRGGIKVSFRSRNDIDCRKWAETFGGGGHQQAAGAIVTCSLEEAVTKVIDSLPPHHG